MTTTRKVDYTEYATRIVRAIPEGVLLTTRAQDRLDTMTIGWGALGTNWSIPVFEAFVRTGRHTARMLEENPEFTVNVPLDEGKEARRRTRKAVGICGTHHGDECDKFEMAALTPVPSCEVSVPGILELPLTLECRVICKQALDVSLLPEELRARFYPADVDGSACGSNRDPHLMVFGRIVGAYVAEAQVGAVKRRFKPYLAGRELPAGVPEADFEVAELVADTKVGERGVYLRAGFDFLPHPYLRLEDVATAEAGTFVVRGCG